MTKNLITPIIAIVGRANVGKSSLFNAVLGRRETIVANESGTTRDSIYAKSEFKNQPFWIVDTAGLKTASDQFELSIQDQIRQVADSADTIWVVIEADAAISFTDRQVAKLALKSQKPVYLVVNKADRNTKAKTEQFQGLGIKTIFLTSATQRRGIDSVLAATLENLPKLNIRAKSEDDVIRVALIGRPNVGKSSLFNSLAKKQQALVSTLAGTTRDINRIEVKYKSLKIELMDTAGVRKQSKIERGVEHFSVLRTLSAIEQSDICLLLMDVNELNVSLDQKLAQIIKDAGKGLILVVSKWDSLGEDKTAFSRDQLATSLAKDFQFVAWAPVIFISSVSGQNVSKLFDLILNINRTRQSKFTTVELNRWLQEAVRAHPPAGLKNRNVKLNYMVQEDNSYPNFKVFGAHTKFLHWSYKRYLERQLRQFKELVGTPIKFWFIEKH